MAQGRRVEKVASLIRREMSDLLVNGVRDERVALGMVSITNVVLAGDLQHCKVLVSIYGSEADQEQAMEGLHSAAAFLRGELGRRLNLRRTPELVFHHDRGLAKGVEVLGLLNQLEQKRQSVNLRRSLAQLIVVRASGFAFDQQRRYPRWEASNAQLQRWLADGVGGVILLGGSAADLALRCRQLQQWAGPERLLLCADVEEGVGQRFEGATWLAPPLALQGLWQADPYRAEQLARACGSCTGQEAWALGLNWVLAPVCDVNNNPANPVINVRAWGEDAASAAALSAAFVQGLQASGVLGCAKHFPGHGDTNQDSHLELPSLAHSRQRLEQVELPPFQAAIAAGVAAVMTAHLQLPALDPQQPATLSAAVLDGLLRRDLGFNGLVVTDALVMEAIAGRHGPGEAAALAFEAGADLLLMPGDVEATLDALEQGFNQGRWPLERLERSLERRQQALQPLAEPPATATEALQLLAQGKAGHGALAQELLQLSLRHRGDPQRLLRGPGSNLIRVDSSLSCPHLPLAAPALLRPQAAGLEPLLVDGRSLPLELKLLPPGPVLLQLFGRGNPFRGSAGMDAAWPQLITALAAQARLAGLVVYGSPYLWEQLAPLLPEGVPGVYSPGQMAAAQALALGWLGLPSAANEGGFTD
jgi:beta-glucosidase